ncbi:MAG: hypothetical protein JRI25_21445 [Deltaproteobacteria bacterium]|nr:hypothetical protein [Deltaproteobacteria bacterium]
MAAVDRREFLAKLTLTTGGLLLLPLAASCGGGSEEVTDAADPGPPEPTEPTGPAEPVATPEATKDLPAVPLVEPDGWDPIAFNKTRGNAGAIPESYHASINGPDGDTAHLGKHLPFVPQVDASVVPAGMLALMWGDPAKGHARHPNAPKGDAKLPKGHFYDWVRVRKATEGEAEEVETTFADWPEKGDGDAGGYAVLGGGDITDDGGKSTIYLVKLPADVAPGDRVRIYAHCLYHGEYVDFLTL